MRKIPPEYDNPIDNMLVNVGESLSPYFKKLNFTANTLTTFSLIFGLLSVYFYGQEKYAFSAIIFMISYMFDCFDGFYARKYDLVTDFGDYYDHVKDWLVYVLVMYLIVMRYYNFVGVKRYLPTITILLILLSSIQIACQEVYRETDQINGNKILSATKWCCPAKDRIGASEYMQYFRYFGTGTLNLYVAILILIS